MSRESQIRSDLAFLLSLSFLLTVGCVGSDDPVSTSSGSPPETNETDLTRDVYWTNATLPANAGAAGATMVKSFQLLVNAPPGNVTNLTVELAWQEPTQVLGLADLFLEVERVSGDRNVMLAETSGSSPLAVEIDGEAYPDGELWVAYGAASPSVHAAAEISIKVTVHSLG